MIRGRFGNTSGRPYVEGRAILPARGLSADVSFILDTGADRTVLMPLDGARMGLDYSVLDDPCESLGVGGYSTDFQEDAVIVFLDEAALQLYAIKLIVSSPSPEIMTIPSLLGRNVIDRWAILYDPSNGVLDAEVRSSDQTVRAPSS